MPAHASQFETACRIFRSIGPGALVWYLGWPALAHAVRGDEPAARACIAEAEALVAAVPPASISVMEALAPMAQAALVLGDHDLAARIYPQLLPFRARHGDFLPERLLGEMATLQRNWLLAAAHLSAAETMTRASNGSPMHALRARVCPNSRRQGQSGTGLAWTIRAQTCPRTAPGGA